MNAGGEVKCRCEVADVGLHLPSGAIRVGSPLLGGPDLLVAATIGLHPRAAEPGARRHTGVALADTENSTDTGDTLSASKCSRARHIWDRNVTGLIAGRQSSICCDPRAGD